MESVRCAAERTGPAKKRIPSSAEASRSPNTRAPGREGLPWRRRTGRSAWHSEDRAVERCPFRAARSCARSARSIATKDPIAVADDHLTAVQLHGFHPPVRCRRSDRPDESVTQYPLLRRNLRQAVRIRDVLVDDSPAPAALHGVECLRGTEMHGQRSAMSRERSRRIGWQGQKGTPCFASELHFLVEEKLGQLGVRRELGNPAA